MDEADDDSDESGESNGRFVEVLAAVSEAYDTDILLYSGKIDIYGAVKTAILVRDLQDKPNVLLHLTTYGGSPDSAYRIGRCLQQAYKTVTVLIDSYCKSAGSLIVVGANRIIMSD